MKRVLVLPAAVFIQVCLGGVYAWSAFVPELIENYGLSTGQTQLIFGLTIATFTVAMVLAGRLMARFGARCMAFVSGVLIFLGYAASAASGGNFLWLMIGFGAIGGAGIGFGYLAPLSTGIRWFPNHKGLVTGVAVAGFGGGAILLSSLTTLWLDSGWTVLEIFRAVGWIYGITICLGALLLFRPPSAGDAAKAALRPVGELVRDPVFLILAAGLFSGTFAGLLVIGNLKPIGMSSGLSAKSAAIAISFFAVGNGVGRIAWGWVSDRLNFLTVPLSLGFLGVALVLLLLGRFSGTFFMAAALITGMGFGACFVVYVAMVAARYGPDSVGSVYPLIFLLYGVAGITGPPIGGWLFDVTNSYLYSILISIGIVIAGCIAGLPLVMKNKLARQKG